MKDSQMPKLPIINFLRHGWKPAISANNLKAGPVINIKEGGLAILTYTSAVDKIKVFSAFIREGLESGDAVWYCYPDEESQTVRAKLQEYGVDVGKYEKDDILHLIALTEFFMPGGKLDYERAVVKCLNWWVWAKNKGYKHVRSVEDVGDFSFVNGQWQKFITDYWLDPRWDDPNVSEWVVSGDTGQAAFVPSLMIVLAINVENMTEKQVTELSKSLGEGKVPPKICFMNLLEGVSSFSRLIGFDHEGLIGRKILLEFDPCSNYEDVVDRLAKESVANVEPIFVFTPKTSPIHVCLTEQPAVKFFLTSISVSTPESTSINEVLLPATNPLLILEAISKVLETYADTNVCFVFDILSELFTSAGQEKTFTFLNHALDMLFSGKVTVLFLFNAGAYESKLVSRIRGLFNNQLTYDKNGLKVVKIS
jgi:hypothetical protein